MANENTKLPEVLARYERTMLEEWMRLLAAERSSAKDGPQQSELREECAEFLRLLRDALQTTGPGSITGSSWSRVREFLAGACAARVSRGYTPSEVATFVFSLKQPLFHVLRHEYPNDAEALADETWTATQLLDKLGLYTTEVYQKSREEMIARQQNELLELSTPVVQLWDGVLALPLIGTLDSARTQVVMQNLLQAIVDNKAEMAIIDITGVPTVDTLVAQHLLKTVAAARLMGADCIISGIRPQIAQTIIHLGVDLANVQTKATLADAFAVALKHAGLAVIKVERPSV